MARAKMEFEQAGLEVVPYPVDFQVSEGKKWSVMDFLPPCFLKSETFFYEKTYILISAAYGRA
jgi:uncharacterized SAM-binding protein YcdF (DUF218 family)